MTKVGTRGPGLFCATLGLSAVVTGGFGWLEVLSGWCIGGVIRRMMPVQRDVHGKVTAWGLLLASGVLMSGVLVLAEKAFPQDSTFPFVSLGLVLLIYRTMIGERETGRMVSNVLGLVLLGGFGTMLLFCFSGGHVEELVIRKFQWKQLWITTILTSPWWTEKEEWGWYRAGGILAVGISMVCRVRLGAALTEYSAVPLYRAAQSIEVMGVQQHMEGLVAAGVLAGAYSMLSLIGETMGNSGDVLFLANHRKITWGIVLVAVFLIEWCYQMLGTVERAGIATAFWGLTGIIALLVVILRKMKKVLDKWRIVG